MGLLMSSFSCIHCFFMSSLMLLRPCVLTRPAIVGKHTLSSPSFHHGVKGWYRRGSPGSTTSSMHGSKRSKQTTASRSNTTSRRTLTSGLLLLLLPLLPLAQVLGPLLEGLHSLEESLGEDVARFSDLHHVVAWMFSCSMAGLTQVKVIADNTFVPVANNCPLE